MNPDSKIYVLRSLVSQQADLKPRFAFRPHQGAERALTFDKAGWLFHSLYQRFWQKGLKPNGHGITLGDSTEEFGISAGINAAPAIFLKELIDNN